MNLKEVQRKVEIPEHYASLETTRLAWQKGYCDGYNGIDNGENVKDWCEKRAYQAGVRMGQADREYAESSNESPSAKQYSVTINRDRVEGER